MKLNQVRGGVIVKVVSRADGMLERKYIGRFGKVVGFDSTDCGASETDPMIMVKIAGMKTDGFWLEELELQRR